MDLIAQILSELIWMMTSMNSMMNCLLKLSVDCFALLTHYFLIWCCKAALTHSVALSIKTWLDLCLFRRWSERQTSFWSIRPTSASWSGPSWRENRTGRVWPSGTSVCPRLRCDRRVWTTRRWSSRWSRTRWDPRLHFNPLACLFSLWNILVIIINYKSFESLKTQFIQTILKSDIALPWKRYFRIFRWTPPL